MARSTKASTQCARRSTDQATLELLGPPCASCRSPAIPWVRASISRIPMGGNLASQGRQGVPNSFQERDGSERLEASVAAHWVQPGIHGEIGHPPRVLATR